MPSLVLAELTEGYDLYEVDGYAMAVPQAFNDFVRAIHIDYDEVQGEYDVTQFIKE